MKITCPNCSAEVEFCEGDCEFCSECGKELQAAGTSAGSDKNLFAGIDFAKIFSSSDTTVTGLAERSKEIADNIENIDFDEPQHYECHCLKVEYNHNLFFLAGSTSVIKLRLTPQDHRLQQLMLFMESKHNGKYSRQEIPVQEILKKERSFELSIPFTPEDICGTMVLFFYLCCKTDNVFNYYQFKVEHAVYDSKQSGNALRSQITINQQFTSNHAADINYRDTIGEALHNMAEQNLSGNEMIKRLNALPPKYKYQRLDATTWRPEEYLIKGNLYHADKLILEYDGISLFLINKPSVKFGKSPIDTDLLVRCGQGRMSAREYPNSTVSKVHTEILYCKDSVKLFDRSSYGTYINGRKPDSAGIPLEFNSTVEFGDIHWKMNIQKCNCRLPHNICQTCSANGIKSLTFTRVDSEPECYLLVWQCCELGRVVKALTDWTVFVRNGYFFIRTPEQEFYHLRPGHTVCANGKKINVKYFEQ